MNRWPLYQVAQPDELFSSWLIRNALAHGCTPLSFAGALWPGLRVWITDIDCCVTTAFLQRFDAPLRADLTSLTLRFQTVLKRLSEPGLRRGNVRWILSQGHRNRWCRCGLQFCPLCFAENVPYFRYQWRLAWHTSCPIHGIRLVSRCSECHAPVQPHLLAPPAVDCRRCHECDGLLSKCEVQPCSLPALKLQHLADAKMRTYCGAEGWFEYAYLLISLLRYSMRNRSQSALGMLKALDVDFETGGVISSGLPLELLEVNERTKLLAYLQQILFHPVEQVIRTVSDYRVPVSVFGGPSLRPNSGTLPMSLISATVTRRPRRSPQVIQRRPADQNDVERKWLRLQRKILSYEGA